tara:strand:+ start:8405 stop:8650 length:246 start_codon:yes stop_codon:yes gene_type:complete
MTTFEITQTNTYDENISGLNPCIRCGKEIKNSKYSVQLVEGDLLALSINEKADESDGGYMGFHPIGSECQKHIPSEFIHKH